MKTKKELNKLIGENLKYARTWRNLYTLKFVSSETGISISFLSDIERGKTMPSIYTLLKLCEFYKVVLAEVLPEEHIFNLVERGV